MRTCLVCLETKPLTEFVKDKRCKEGRSNYCKKCKVKEHKKWRHKNIEHYLEYESYRRNKDRQKYNQRIKKFMHSEKGKAKDIERRSKVFFSEIGIKPTESLLVLKCKHLTLMREIRTIRRQRRERKAKG